VAVTVTIQRPAPRSGHGVVGSRRHMTRAF
jgi:hypothetical protein